MDEHEHENKGHGENEGHGKNEGHRENVGGGENAAQANGRRKRRSRWEPETEAEADEGKKRKSMDCGESDPQVQVLNLRLFYIERRLQTGLVVDDSAEGARSPSPEPLYDNLGIRMNTRENRAREKLLMERRKVISEMIKKNPAFKPPADYRPPKLTKKLYVPTKEYPDYNFIGLIIGPRGNTLKRMEKETGAKIFIRGKEPVKEGRSQKKLDIKSDRHDNEDLHVQVEADDQLSLDMAVDMLEKLLVPVHGGRNKHKLDQLRELAALSGTLRCRICGDGEHITFDCPMKGLIQGAKMGNEYRNFLTEHGGGGPEGSMEKSNSDFQRPALPSNSPWAGGAGGLGNTGSGIRGADSSESGGSGSSQHGQHRPGLGFNPENKLNKEIDDTILFVGYLPHTVDDDRLIQLFSPFGRVEKSKIMKDRMNGTSRGYGFVKYFDAGCAAQAVTHMNGYKLEGKTLAVRVAGLAPLPPGSGLGPEGSMEKSNSDFQQPVRPSNSPWAGGAGGVGNTGSGIRGADSSGSGGSGASKHGQHRPGLGFNPENKLNEEIDDTNLYVAYLPHTVDDDRLIQLFSPFGRVEKSKIMMDRMKGTSKGYGFVKYFDAGCAAQAVTHMNGYKLEGRTLSVRVAGRAPLPPGSGLGPEGSMETSNSDFQRPVRPSNSPWAGGAGGVGNTGSGIRGADSSGSGGSGASQHGHHRPDLGFNPENKLNEEIDDTNLYVAYLPHTVDDDRLIQLFSPFGRVEKSKIMMDRMNGTSKGYGFVKYFDAGCAVQAVTHMNGYKLEGKTLAVRVAGRAPLPPGPGLGPAGGAYAQQQPQPSMPMTPGSYGPPPWISQSSSGHFSNNHAFRMPNPSDPVQKDPYSAPPTHYVSYSPYQMPLPSTQMHGNMQIQARAQQVQIMQGSSIAQQIPGIQGQPGTQYVSGMSGPSASQQVPAMQTPPGSELVSGNELSRLPPWSDAPPLGGMPQFSENKPSMLRYQPYPGTQYVSGMSGPPASQQVPAMQTPPGSELVSGNELSSHPPWSDTPPLGGMPQFSENKPSMPRYQPYYAPPPIPPSNMASSLPPPHTSVPSAGGGTPQWASFAPKQDYKAVETEYENFLSEMGWRHQHKIST